MALRRLATLPAALLLFLQQRVRLLAGGLRDELVQRALVELCKRTVARCVLEGGPVFVLWMINKE